mgnify:CR=1 FL=1
MANTFEEKLAELVNELYLSTGEVLSVAREIAHDDSLRTVDRLTRAERNEMILALEHLRLRVCAPA